MLAVIIPFRVIKIVTRAILAVAAKRQTTLSLAARGADCRVSSSVTPLTERIITDRLNQMLYQTMIISI